MLKRCLHISSNQFEDLSHQFFTKKIWQELSKDFDEYHIIARATQNKFGYSKDGNIHLHLVPALGNKARTFMFSSFYMFKLIHKYKITHLLAQSSILGGFTGALASKLYKIPMMCEVHGEEYFRYFSGNKMSDFIFSRISKFSFRTACKVRSLNELMTSKLKKYGITNIVEIPNRVDLSTFNRQKNNFERSQSTIRLVSVGRFVKEKNYLNLIIYLCESNIDFHLTLIGGGPLKSTYEEYIYQNNRQKNIELIDWIKQDDLVDLVTQSDIYIQYSISEGMPRTIIEAMAMKMPIISTEVGSIAGVLKSNYNALTIDVNNKDSLLSAINEFSTNMMFGKKMAENAYWDAQNKYEWKEVFAKYRDELVNMKYQ